MLQLCFNLVKIIALWVAVDTQHCPLTKRIIIVLKKKKQKNIDFKTNWFKKEKNVHTMG